MTDLTLLLLICVSIFQTSFEIEPEIDQDHLNVESSCGIKPQRVGYRISNSKQSEEIYPWAIHVERKVKNRPLFDGKVSGCGGTIITRQ